MRSANHSIRRSKLDKFGKKISLISILLLLSPILLSKNFGQEFIKKRSEQTVENIPRLLKDWQAWALWDDQDILCPYVYNSGEERLCQWPTEVELVAQSKSATWTMNVTASKKLMHIIPGDSDLWPFNVLVDGEPQSVIEQAGRPTVLLDAGKHIVSGEFVWERMPQKIQIPSMLGIVHASLDGKLLSAENYDGRGFVWLKRNETKQRSEDNMSLKVYRLISDGVPMWLHTRVELSVSGKSREEKLGSVLPKDWILADIKSPLPTNIDDEGNLRVQVRAGRWTINLNAFSTNAVKEFRFKKGAKPPTSDELFGFKADDKLRLVEIKGADLIDVSQTTYPADWRRGYPVYLWQNDSTVKILEKLRGSTRKTPQDLSIERHFWLNDKEKNYTYFDQISGENQIIWRLNVADDHELGAAKMNGKGLLITSDPNSSKAGVEIRQRDIKLQASGKIKSLGRTQATGWDASAGKLRINFHLPPAWRMLAVFGADKSSGDWLTAWDLLGIFLLLLFSFAVLKLYNIKAAVIALLAFALSYHEPYALRYLWLFLLVFIALARYVSGERASKFFRVSKFVVILLVLLHFIPFLSYQIQTLIYPQLEKVGQIYPTWHRNNPAMELMTSNLLNRRNIKQYKPSGIASSWGLFGSSATTSGRKPQPRKKRRPEKNEQVLYSETIQDEETSIDPFSKPEVAEMSRNLDDRKIMGGRAPASKMIAPQRLQQSDTANLRYSTQQKIQTGPALPNWRWQEVRCDWNSPVSAEHEFKPILISAPLWRLISVIRIILLLALLSILLGLKKISGKSSEQKEGDSERFSLFKNFTKVPKNKKSGKTKSDKTKSDKTKEGGNKMLLATLMFCVLFLSWQSPASAEDIPNLSMLKTLRERLLKMREDGFDWPIDSRNPAADIANMNLKLGRQRLKMSFEVHALRDVAVPLPGQLPAWSPLRVRVNGVADAALLRKNSYLWIALPKGIHQVEVDGLLPNSDEWHLSYLLKPRRASVVAPSWEVSGLDENGVLRGQLFFTRKNKALRVDESFERERSFTPIAVVERDLEIGLLWKVRTRVRRLSSLGIPMSLEVPLLAGENVLDEDVKIIKRKGKKFMLIEMAANSSHVFWNSEMKEMSKFTLQAADSDRFVERWRVMASPVWHVNYAGIAPIFEQRHRELTPLWIPWPKEKLELHLSKPEAILGQTVTIDSAVREISLGKRHGSTKLTLNIESSVSKDIRVKLPEGSEIGELKRNGVSMEARFADKKLILSLRPGVQRLEISWRKESDLNSFYRLDKIVLPIKGANLETELKIPENLWLLWAYGDDIGPAVRFWPVLIFALLIAWVLGSLRLSPLTRMQWFLLFVGLTQTKLFGAICVVLWLFLLVWRGRDSFAKLDWFKYNFVQLFIIFWTIASIAILFQTVSVGLLGSPEMFVIGNGSSLRLLRWFTPVCDEVLPRPFIFALSIWFYRLFMLIWALWLSNALIKWLIMGWKNFCNKGAWKRRVKSVKVKAKKH